MAYQTGSPASTQNLIDTLITWAVAQGGFTLGNTWTFNSAASPNIDSTGSTTGYTARALARDGQYVLLAWETSSPSHIYLNSSTNNPTTGKLNAQTNGSSESQRVELGTSPVTYWMFADGYGVNCVVQWVGGAYQHINFGYLRKHGAFTGGVYVTGTYNNRVALTAGNYFQPGSSNIIMPFSAWSESVSYPSGHVRAAYNSLNLHSFGRNAGKSGGVAISLSSYGGDGSDTYAWYYTKSPNSFNGRAILAPIEVLIGETDLSAPASWIPLGRVENAAHVSIENLNAADIVLTDWMVFPTSAKNAGGTPAIGYVNSLNYGMAYKK